MGFKDQPLNLTTNARKWLSDGEHGISSKVIFSCLSGLDLGERYKSTPSDPDDFRRCYELILMVPEWRDELYKVGEISSAWFNVVKNWDKLTGMLLDQYERRKKGRSQNNGMYEFMKSLGC